MKKFALFAGLVFALSACGDGGNSAPPPVQLPQATNNPPQISAVGTQMVPENTEQVTTVQASDADGDTLNFSLSGSDAAQFAISGSGQITFRERPNFELPTDADLNNIYELTVSVSDGTATVNTSFQVNVENDREGISVRLVASGIFDVSDMAAITSSPDILIARRPGEVLHYSADSESISVERRVSVSTPGGGDLLGIAFNPMRTRTFYLTYSFRAPDGNGGNAPVVGLAEALRLTEILRAQPGLTAATAPAITQNDAEFVFASPANPQVDGGMAFDSTGAFLFLGIGDGGATDETAQTIVPDQGKIHRLAFTLDPFAGAAPLPPFTIPNDNPYVNFGANSPSIFSLGTQNPRNFFVNDGNLIFADAGTQSDQEINVLDISDRFANFGWPRFIGSELVRQGIALFNNAADEAHSPAVTHYGQGTGDREGSEVVGGAIYTGPIESLRDKYIFADSASGSIWAVSSSALLSGDPVDASQYELLNADFSPSNVNLGNVVSFVINGDKFYFADDNGNIFVVESG